MKNETKLGIVGDLLVDREDPLEAFDQVQRLLSWPDVLIGNCEGVYADDPQPAPSVGIPVIPRARYLDALPQAGFDVLSLANNHSIDAGHAAMLENRERLRKAGCQTCGAGPTLQAAREPALVQAGDSTIAVLGYACVFPMGYEARSNVPGVVPMRGYDFWQPAYENYHIPGTPPKTRTILDENDLAALRADIAAARERADIVIASIHWGDFLRPYHLTDLEKELARLAIDAGVDVVAGCHHHTLRGIDWYRNKPIFYGLGHFVFDLKLQLSDEARAMFAALPPDAAGYQLAPREGWPLLPMHEDARLTAFAYVTASGEEITGAGFVPCRLRPDGRVVAVAPDSEEGAEVVAYVEHCNRSQGIRSELVAVEREGFGACIEVRPGAEEGR
ncbi:MAG: CapA family protein [Pseudohaliea sp.]